MLQRTPLLIEAASHKVKHLHVFDMDGSLLVSPEPGWGKDWYRYHTRTPTNPRGNNWDKDHKGWWSNPATLHSPKQLKHAPFPIKPIEHTVKGYHAAKASPHSKVVVMTGRLDHPEMRKAVSGALHKIGVKGHEHGKDLFLNPGTKPGDKRVDTHQWKANMLHRFSKEHPHLKHVHMWDDREEHIDHFSKTLKALKLKHTLHHVKDPRWKTDMPKHS